MTTMTERRSSHRMRTFWKGVILYPGGLRSIECTVRNFSEQGVRLDCGGVLDVPDHFDLKIPQKGAVFACQVAWRKDNEIGAGFVRPPPGAAADALAEKLRLLEAQNRKLMRKVSERDDEGWG